MVLNSAFVFLKPAAVTDAMKDLVHQTFDKKGIRIVQEGRIDAAEIDKKQLIDKHYYAIASKATLVTPDKLNVPADKFKSKFGVEWADVLKGGKALNARAACEKFGVDADGLNEMWSAAKTSNNFVKLGGGFYCAKLESDGKGPFYVFNGFFMKMRSGFVKEGACIHYYVVEWDAKILPWSDFRGKVLGPTDPMDAPGDSIRGAAFTHWRELGLLSEPNVGENCCHASASPFEGLCERMNWLGHNADRDKWGKALLDAGVRLKTIKEWSLDPVVTYGAKLNPTSKSIWDTLEDMDSNECIHKCIEIADWTPLNHLGSTTQERPLKETESTAHAHYRWPHRDAAIPPRAPECKFVTTSTHTADYHVKPLDVRANPSVHVPKNARPFDGRTTYGTHYSEREQSNYNSQTRTWDKTH